MKDDLISVKRETLDKATDTPVIFGQCTAHFQCNPLRVPFTQAGKPFKKRQMG